MKKILFFILFVVCSNIIYSQEYDIRVLRHHTVDELIAMGEEKAEIIRYYYCDSYMVELGKDTKFNVKNFDVYGYENLRKDEEEVVIKLKTGARITLIPNNSLAKRYFVKSNFYNL